MLPSNHFLTSVLSTPSFSARSSVPIPFALTALFTTLIVALAALDTALSIVIGSSIVLANAPVSSRSILPLAYILNRPGPIALIIS